MKVLRVALTGNPNSGKTTVFNALTGARRHVGNYPGVTVERVEGDRIIDGVRLNIIDLPGTYSLSAHSEEERIARHELIQGRPDLVVDIVDASNIERNLYLAVQLVEMRVPLVIVLNMMDLARVRGMTIDAEALSRLIGAPVIPVVATKGEGMDRLLRAMAACVGRPLEASPLAVTYGKDIEESLTRIEAGLKHEPPFPGMPARWTAVKMLEEDGEVCASITKPELRASVETERERLRKVIGDEPDILIAEHRYGLIAGLIQETVRSSVEQRVNWSDQVDRVLTHRLLGLPIFAGLMYLTFWLTFTLGSPPMDWLDAGFTALGEWVNAVWPAGWAPLPRSLIVDGLIAGVGGVLVFLPNILLLFLAIGVLEDSGYMSRAAFLMDRLMHKIGLHGKSFIPMLIGFGCSVPAILATRTLETRRDRLTTMLVVPLMSCGARLPIYMLIIPAFFPERLRAPMLWGIYAIGIVLAILVAKFLRKAVFKGELVPFVMELPPYRAPTLRGLWLHMWGRGGMYVQKAGTLILGASVVLWALTTFPKLNTVDPGATPEQQRAAELSHTVAGRIGHAIEPVLKPIGFDWRIGTAMIGAFAAKEVFVAQMGIVFAVGEGEEAEDSLRERLRANYTPLTGFCIMLFMLVSMPCMATVAVVRREANSWTWALLQLGGLTLLAYVLTLLVYQLGSALGF